MKKSSDGYYQRELMVGVNQYNGYHENPFGASKMKSVVLDGENRYNLGVAFKQLGWYRGNNYSSLEQTLFKGFFTLEEKG